MVGFFFEVSPRTGAKVFEDVDLVHSIREAVFGHIALNVLNATRAPPFWHRMEHVDFERMLLNEWKKLQEFHLGIPGR